MMWPRAGGTLGNDFGYVVASFAFSSTAAALGSRAPHRDVQGVYVRALAALPCRLEQRWRRLNVMEAARSTCTMSSNTGMLLEESP